MSRQNPPHQPVFHHVVLAAALALSAVACAKDVPTGAQPCPCAAGYVCCKSGICAQGQDACEEATAALSSQAVGRWTGYIENYKGLASGADSLTLSFSLADDGTLQGTATLGDAAAPPPATDPNVPWPPGITEREAESIGILEGFAYPAHAIKWEARRLRFDIYEQEPWKAWCELQTPHGTPTLVAPPDGGTEPVPSIDWACGLDHDDWWDRSPSDPTVCEIGHSPDRNPIGTLPCGVLELCQQPGNPCICSSTGCTTPTPTSSLRASVVSFDIALVGDSGDGSVSLDDMYNLRLVRASH